MDNRKQFGNQMDASKEKDNIAVVCKQYSRKNVLDLGAGTCKISKQIAEQGIHVVAVDSRLSEYNIERVNNVDYVEQDLNDFVKNTTDKFDGIILSGVLHELNKTELKTLSFYLNKCITKDAIIIIREPIYDYGTNNPFKKFYKPFKSLAAQKRCVEIIEAETPDYFKDRFMRAKKLHEKYLPAEIKCLNMAFTYSYGSSSWEREVAEYRFTYSKSDMMHFIKDIFGTSKYEFNLTNVFDESYRKYFKLCGYSNELLNCIDYTNSTMLLFKRK